jgi:hypothetical protein
MAMGTRAYIPSVLFLLALLPALAVHTASPLGRVIWSCAVVQLSFLAFALADPSAQRAMKPPSPPGPFENRFRPKLVAWLLAWLAAADIASVAATYAQPDNLVGKVAWLVSRAGAALFPVVAKFDALVPPLEESELLKVQTMMSAWHFAAASIVVAMAIYVFAMPRVEWLAKMTQSSGKSHFPIAMVALAVLVFVPTMSATWLGWLEFPGIGGRCLLKATCYGRNGDLFILLAAIFKTVLLTILPICLMVGVRRLSVASPISAERPVEGCQHAHPRPLRLARHGDREGLDRL